MQANEIIKLLHMYEQHMAQVAGATYDDLRSRTRAHTCTHQNTPLDERTVLCPQKCDQFRCRQNCANHHAGGRLYMCKGWDGTTCHRCKHACLLIGWHLTIASVFCILCSVARWLRTDSACWRVDMLPDCITDG